MIDLSIESLDLDYLLSDSEEHPGQSNFRDKPVQKKAVKANLS